MVEPGTTASGLAAGTGADSRARTRRWRIPAVLLLVAAAGVGCGEPSQEPATHTVAIRSFRFEPPRLTVRAGDTIVWSNEDAVPHTATAADGGWDTRSVAGRASASLVLDAPGTHEYVCAFHPNMRAVVTVE